MTEDMLDDLRNHLAFEQGLAASYTRGCSCCRDWLGDHHEARADFIKELLEEFPILRTVASDD